MAEVRDGNDPKAAFLSGLGFYFAVLDTAGIPNFGDDDSDFYSRSKLSERSQFFTVEIDNIGMASNKDLDKGAIRRKSRIRLSRGRLWPLYRRRLAKNSTVTTARIEQSPASLQKAK